MLQQLLKPWEISVFQLYPKPERKGQLEHAQEKRERRIRRPGLSQDAPRSDSTYYHNYNNFVRCRIENLRFETRKKGTQIWTPTARENVLCRKGGSSIVKNLEDVCEASNAFKGSSGDSFDTAQGSSDTASL